MLITFYSLDYLVFSYNVMLLSSHLGHFTLSIKLLPLLKQTAEEPGSDVRIVTVRLLRYVNFENEFTKYIY